MFKALFKKIKGNLKTLYLTDTNQKSPFLALIALKCIKGESGLVDLASTALENIKISVTCLEIT